MSSVFFRRLFLLQFAKGRKCVVDRLKYDEIVMKICSKVFLESVTIYYRRESSLLDLFLEQSRNDLKIVLFSLFYCFALQFYCVDTRDSSTF